MPKFQIKDQVTKDVAVCELKTDGDSIVLEVNGIEVLFLDDDGVNLCDLNSTNIDRLEELEIPIYDGKVQVYN